MKVKVDKQLFESLEYWGKTYGLEDLVNDFIFRCNINLPYYTKNYKCFNELNVQDMLNIFKYGYELEEVVINER